VKLQLSAILQLAHQPIPARYPRSLGSTTLLLGRSERSVFARPYRETAAASSGSDSSPNRRRCCAVSELLPNATFWPSFASRSVCLVGHQRRAADLENRNPPCATADSYSYLANISKANGTACVFRWSRHPRRPLKADPRPGGQEKPGCHSPVREAPAGGVMGYSLRALPEWARSTHISWWASTARSHVSGQLDRGRRQGLFPSCPGLSPA